MFEHYRSLLAVRRASLALQRGDLSLVRPSSEQNASKILAYVREHQDQAVIVVANFGNAPSGEITLDLSEAGVPAGSLVDPVNGEVLEALSSANAAAYPVAELGAFGWRLLTTAP